MTAAHQPASGFVATWADFDRLLRECEDREPTPPPPSCREEASHRAGMTLTACEVTCHPRGTCDVTGALLWAGTRMLDGQRVQVAYLGNVARTHYPWRLRLVTAWGVCRGDGATLAEASDLALQTLDQRRFRVLSGGAL